MQLRSSEQRTFVTHFDWLIGSRVSIRTRGCRTLACRTKPEIAQGKLHAMMARNLRARRMHAHGARDEAHESALVGPRA
jgi:hypothetical protein